MIYEKINRLVHTVPLLHGPSTAAIESVKAAACVNILLRQSKYLNNIVEQDHRAIKRITGPMLGVQVIVECSNTHRSQRDHAHDS